MAFIGASLKEVRDAIKRKKMRFASKFDFLDVRGAGTRKASNSLFRAIAKQWWNSPPGTKIVVGWIHSDGLKYQQVYGGRWVYEDGHRDHGIPQYKIATISVARPPDEQLRFYKGPYRSTNSVRKKPDIILLNVLKDQIWRYDDRYRRLLVERGPETPVIPEWDGDDGHTHELSPLFLWPAGIVDNNRLSNALNALEKSRLKRLQKSWNEATDLSLSCGERRQKLMKRVLGPHVRRRKEANVRTRKRFANVMTELRAVPRGAIHKSFPGGENYRASIRRLENLTKNWSPPSLVGTKRRRT